jgi:2,3-bisphosphoglycerate-independent phosphoglycerate mutase
MKVVVLQAGGMADEPIVELGGKTPLEYARTPHLDQMAARGILGQTRTISRGLPPGSDVGTLASLGYDPTRHRGSAAAFEAAGLGVELGPDDVAFRCNLVTLEPGEDGAPVMRDFAAGHPPTAEAAALVADLGRALAQDGLELHAGLSYRHLLVWRCGEAGMRTVPPHDLADKPVAPALPEGPGAEVLRDLMTRAEAVLAEHPTCIAKRARGERAPSGIWLWGQGRRVTLPSLGERFGTDGAVVAAVDLVNGIGTLAGLARVRVPGATGFFDTDYRGKAAAGLQALAERGFLFLHVEAADEGGHMGDPQRKVEVAERFDAEVVGPLLEGLRQTGDEWRVLVLPDHATPCTQRRHTDDPVPFLVYVSADEHKTRTVARGYGERDAREQGIFIPEAHTLLERLFRR